MYIIEEEESRVEDEEELEKDAKINLRKTGKQKSEW